MSSANALGFGLVGAASAAAAAALAVAYASSSQRAAVGEDDGGGEQAVPARLGLLLTSDAAHDGTKAALKEEETAETAGTRVDLHAELSGLRLKALQARAAAEGIDEGAIDDALEADRPKQALVELVVQHTSRRIGSQGPPERILAALRAGGSLCSNAMSDILEHSIELLEHTVASSPRRSRQRLRVLLGGVEEALEATDDHLGDAVARSEGDVLSGLLDALAAVQGLAARDADADDVLAAVAALLEQHQRCREIGDRGRADAAVVAVGAFDGLEPQPEVEGVEREGGDAAAASTALSGSMTVGTLVQAELSALRLKALQARAATEGVDEGAIDDALEADRPKVALVELILQHMSSCAQESAAGLRKLRPTQLKQRAREAGAPEDAIGATDDAPQPKEALIALVIGAEARGAGPPASPD